MAERVRKQSKKTSQSKPKQQSTHKQTENHQTQHILQQIKTGNQSLSSSDVLHLQRTLGNQQTQELLQRDSDQDGTVVDPTKKKYEDFDGKQYRVSGVDPNRKVEEVKRMTMVDGTVYYVSMGEVTGFTGKKPIVNYYKEPKDLGEWYPRVTHVNGMNVKPESGINDAMSLQANLNQELNKHDGDFAMSEDAIDVLYTYSTTFSFIPDVYDCIKGKLGFSDDVIQIQKQTMLDAVNNKHRVSISAHSRGTIKTDNAVRLTHAELTEKMIPIIMEEVGGSLDLQGGDRAKIERAIHDIAQVRAKEEMDQYINLTYAGNAVEFPSSVLPVDFIVGSYDAISMLVGTYTKWGSKYWGIANQGHDDSTMTKVWQGHSYNDYAPTVAQLIGQDIIKEQ